MIYANEIFKPVQIGQRMKAFIARIREDGKIDLRLEKEGYEKIDQMSAHILKKLGLNQGFLPASDKSEAEYIYQLFGMSKKNFKKSIGSLYKQKLILIEEGGIRLVLPSGNA